MAFRCSALFLLCLLTASLFLLLYVTIGAFNPHRFHPIRPHTTDSHNSPKFRPIRPDNTGSYVDPYRRLRPLRQRVNPIEICGRYVNLGQPRRSYRNNTIDIRQILSGYGDRALSLSDLFTVFKRTHAKSYSTQAEHDYRLSVFMYNLSGWPLRYRPSFVYLITETCDLMPDEIPDYVPDRDPTRLPGHSGVYDEPILATDDVVLRWREHGGVRRTVKLLF